MGSLGPHDGYMLRLFGAHINQAFGHVPYHVGSSLAEKATFRDVDVRLILPDDEFAAYFGDPLKPGWDGPRLNVWNHAWTVFGKNLAHLPIDFQFQQQTVANANFDGPRSALLITSDDLPFVRGSSEPR